MGNYRLDDLMDWGKVLAELEELIGFGLLDEHQDGLSRILRYRPYWRLRECALACAQEVSLPNDRLILEVCSVMCDEESYAELRMRAAEVVADLLVKRAEQGEAVPHFDGVAIPEKMKQLLDGPLSPLLDRTLKAVLAKIKEDGS